MDEIEKYYKILNLQPGASLDEVKQGYRKLAFVWHPDRYPHDSRLQARAEQKFKEINYAYVRLRLILTDSPTSVASATRQPPPPPSQTDSTASNYSYYRNRPPNQAYSTAPTQPDSLVPWGWLAGTLLGYTLIGWILATLTIPPWVWTFTGMAWFTITIAAAVGPRVAESWFMALVFAGTLAGWMIGNQAGGGITAIVWGMIGAALGAIAGSEAPPLKAVIWVLALSGISGITGLVAGSKTGDWRGALLGGMMGATLGATMGIVSDSMFKIKTRSKMGAGSVFGLGFGAWLGAWTGAGSDAVVRAIEKTGLDMIIGAWGAIAVVAGVVAQMVSGEKLIESFNQFYTFVILAATSGFGLVLGWWLASNG